MLFMDDLKKPYGKNENQVDSLVPSVRIVAEDTPMEFGIPKCAILLMKHLCPGLHLIRCTPNFDIQHKVSP